jgi:hypothetical protein
VRIEYDPGKEPNFPKDMVFSKMGTHFGASDHEVFNDWGVSVPGVVMNTWPDQWYHTSGDQPDKLDPTQLKRAVVITAAAAYTIASADDRTAGQIAAEIVSNASARIGHQLARGLEELKRADREGFPGINKKGRAYIEASAINERATLDSVRQLAADKPNFGKYLETQKTSVTGLANADSLIDENRNNSLTTLNIFIMLNVDGGNNEKINHRTGYFVAFFSFCVRSVRILSSV